MPAATAEVSNTKQQKLVKLGTIRVTRAIKALDFVGQLAKYDPTQEQKNRILNAITEAYEAALAKFDPKPSASKTIFTL